MSAESDGFLRTTAEFRPKRGGSTSLELRSLSSATDNP